MPGPFLRRFVCTALLGSALMAPGQALAAKHTQWNVFSVSEAVTFNNSAFPQALPTPAGSLESAYPSADISGAASLVLDGFDPSLGTLQSVRLDFESVQTLYGGGSIFRPDGAAPGVIEIAPEATGSVAIGGVMYGSNGVTLDHPREGPPSCATAATPGCIVTRTSTEAFDVDVMIAPLSVFTAPTVTISLPFFYEVDGFLATNGVRPIFTAFANFDWSGEARLTYNYLPAEPVPEPATWAMLLCGFGLLGTAIRRRQARSWARARQGAST